MLLIDTLATVALATSPVTYAAPQDVTYVNTVTVVETVTEYQYVTVPLPVRCFEDEVIVWTGERHDACVPLDDLYPDTTGHPTWDPESERRP